MSTWLDSDGEGDEPGIPTWIFLFFSLGQPCKPAHRSDFLSKTGSNENQSDLLTKKNENRYQFINLAINVLLCG